MTYYTLIDNVSGFVWWQGPARDEIDACLTAIEEAEGRNEGVYDLVHPSELAANETGFHVYATPSSFVVEDGQLQESIELVEQFERVAVVKVTDSDY